MVYVAFLCLVEFLCIIVLTIIAKHDLGYDYISYSKLLVKLAILTVVSALISYCGTIFIIKYIQISALVVRLLSGLLVVAISVIIVIYLFMTKTEKELVNNLLKKVVRRK